MSVLSKIYFHNTKAAFDHLEKILWAGEPICPHCGTVANATKLQGESTRPGLWKCKTKECRKQFTVTVGTVFESRHIPLPKMLQAVYLMACSKKGVSSHQLHRILQIQYKSAWFLTHRIREAMRDGKLGPMGGPGSVVEADETYFGPVAEPRTTRTSGKPFTKGSTGVANKRSVVSLVERGGSVRSFHVDRADKATINKIVTENVVRESKLHTDESRLYSDAHKHVAMHDTVNHTAKQYVRYTKAVTFPDGKPYVVHTNTVEGFYSIFKRGMKGIYQHCSEKHLHRYLAEFDFRYNARSALGVEDQERAAKALRGIVGKRLTYGGPVAATQQT